MTDRVSKSWAYTLNNYTDEDIKQLENLECNYHIFGKEKGENNTPHIQGQITFKKAYRLSGLKKIHNRIHWEETKNVEHSINYCTKEQNYFIKDNRSQGKRTDLLSAIETLRTKGIEEVKKEHPLEYIKFYKGMEKLIENNNKRNFKPEVYWIHGPTGTSKTRRVVESEPDLWISGKNLKWWDGYCNQSSVLFDDFRKDFCTFHELLRILDRYPYRVEYKGGSTEFNSKKIYITSCFSPYEVYETREDIGQLIRRIDKIIDTSL